LKENKKVAICLNTSWNIYNFRLNLARALKNTGYEVVLIAPYDKYSELLKKEFEYYDIYMNNKGTNPIQDLKTLIEFYKLFKKIKPDIILNYTIKPNIYGNIAAHFLGIKTINNIAGLGILFVNEGIITKIAKWLYKISQKNSSKIFFQNREDYEIFIKEKIVDKNKCDILPGSGIDTIKFTPIERKKDGIFRFLLLSRMLWEKGVGEYVEAAKIIKQKYKNVEFQLLGFLDTDNRSAISKEQMDKWVKEGYVTYLGVSDNVKEVIAQADCIVLPSYYREGTPRTLLESASMAKPIITTDNVGCHNVVDDGINGYLCKTKNIQDLVNKMEKMLNLSEEARKKMGEAGRKKMIKEFDEKIVINKYLQTIKELS
jgi:glycosyltransferase involved in cell wall biosynthesis